MELTALCPNAGSSGVHYTPGAGQSFTVHPLKPGFSGTFSIGTPSQGEVTYSVVDVNKFTISATQLVNGTSTNMTGVAWIKSGCTDQNGYIRIGGLVFKLNGSGSAPDVGSFSVSLSIDLSFDPYLYTVVGTNLPLMSIGGAPATFRVGDTLSVDGTSVHLQLGGSVSAQGQTQDICAQPSDCSFSDSYPQVTTTVDSIEQVSVPAGTFQAVKVITQLSYGPEDTRWFAGDVGQVQVITPDIQTGAEVTGQLIRWSNS